MRVGLGYDVHRLESGRALIIGGVTVPFEKGLAGHSDADVLAHAIADALLGAAGLRDLGAHFPPGDPQYKDISSLKILAQVYQELHNQGLAIENIDATIICEQPKLAPHLPAMKENLCAVLKLDPSQLGIKATTEEGLGFTGTGEGIAAQAICLLR